MHRTARLSHGRAAPLGAARKSTSKRPPYLFSVKLDSYREIDTGNRKIPADAYNIKDVA